jgi:hypothetical protein
VFHVHHPLPPRGVEVRSPGSGRRFREATGERIDHKNCGGNGSHGIAIGEGGLWWSWSSSWGRERYVLAIAMARICRSRGLETHITYKTRRPIFSQAFKIIDEIGYARTVAVDLDIRA